MLFAALADARGCGSSTRSPSRRTLRLRRGPRPRHERRGRLPPSPEAPRARDPEAPERRQDGVLRAAGPLPADLATRLRARRRRNGRSSMDPTTSTRSLDASLAHRLRELAEATAAKKCHACGCFQAAVAAFEQTEAGGASSRPFRQRAMETFAPRKYDCLGCEVCFPAVAENAFADAFPGEARAPLCPTDAPRSAPAGRRSQATTVVVRHARRSRSARLTARRSRRSSPAGEPGASPSRHAPHREPRHRAHRPERAREPERPVPRPLRRGHASSHRSPPGPVARRAVRERPDAGRPDPGRARQAAGSEERDARADRGVPPARSSSCRSSASRTRPASQGRSSPAPPATPALCRCAYRRGASRCPGARAARLVLDPAGFLVVYPDRTAGSSSSTTGRKASSTSSSRGQRRVPSPPPRSSAESCRGSITRSTSDGSWRAPRRACGPARRTCRTALRNHPQPEPQRPAPVPDRPEPPPDAGRRRSSRPNFLAALVGRYDHGPARSGCAVALALGAASCSGRAWSARRASWSPSRGSESAWRFPTNLVLAAGVLLLLRAPPSR